MGGCSNCHFSRAVWVDPPRRISSSQNAFHCRWVQYSPDSKKRTNITTSSIIRLRAISAGPKIFSRPARTQHTATATAKACARDRQTPTLSKADIFSYSWPQADHIGGDVERKNGGLFELSRFCGRRVIEARGTSGKSNRSDEVPSHQIPARHSLCGIDKSRQKLVAYK